MKQSEEKAFWAEETAPMPQNSVRQNPPGEQEQDNSIKSLFLFLINEFMQCYLHSIHSSKFDFYREYFFPDVFYMIDASLQKSY